MEKSKKKHIGIIGGGRFTETLLRLFGKDFVITVCGIDKKSLITLQKKYPIKITINLKDLVVCDAVFFAVPISEFEEVLQKYSSLMKNKQTLIDVLSVKSYPKEVSRKILKDTNILFTHPMFGPDSSQDGFKNLPIMVDDSMCENKDSSFWKTYFKKKGLKIVEISCDEHDKLAARSQGLAHFLGRMLADFKIKPTTIDTLGAKRLLEIKEQASNDTLQLFYDLQHYNPYTKKMRIDLGKSFDVLFNQLLPERVDARFTTFGIQGAKGSFSEQAIEEYIKNKNIKNPSVKYLFTSRKVLDELFKGEIDFGLCALHNSLGGVVDETIEAIAEYKCKIVEEVDVKVRHFLMKRKDVPFNKITHIMAHPQVFKQCKNNLKKFYSSLKTISGKGDLMDTAKAAEALYLNTLPKNYAILGSKSIAYLYNLEIVKEDLQDDEDNFTSFVLLKRA
jgi:arogenate dehydrogenase (NADP+)